METNREKKSSAKRTKKEVIIFSNLQRIYPKYVNLEDQNNLSESDNNHNELELEDFNDNRTNNDDISISRELKKQLEDIKEN
jgi:hypothetical protein